jgi:hypothetical protein
MIIPANKAILTIRIGAENATSRGRSGSAAV